MQFRTLPDAMVCSYDPFIVDKCACTLFSSATFVNQQISYPRPYFSRCFVPTNDSSFVLFDELNTNRISRCGSNLEVQNLVMFTLPWNRLFHYHTQNLFRNELKQAYYKYLVKGFRTYFRKLFVFLTDKSKGSHPSCPAIVKLVGSSLS